MGLHHVNIMGFINPSQGLGWTFGTLVLLHIVVHDVPPFRSENENRTDLYFWPVITFLVNGIAGGALHAQPDLRITYHGTYRLHENAVIKMVNSDLTILCTLTLTLSSLILIPQLILLQVILKWRENSYHFYLWFSYWQKVHQVCIHWVMLCMYGIVEGLRLMFIFW